jgi:hypothetical protein
MVPGPEVSTIGPANYLCVDGVGFERACMQQMNISSIEAIAPLTERYFCAESEMGDFSPDQCVSPD